VRSRTAKILAVVLTGAGLSVPIASPASAFPEHCWATRGQGDNAAVAYCYTSASGTRFRGVAYCRYLTPSGSFDHAYFYGPWRVQGDSYTSWAACGAGWSLLSVNAQTG
jgi:hypothetical protein